MSRYHGCGDGPLPKAMLMDLNRQKGWKDHNASGVHASGRGPLIRYSLLVWFSGYLFALAPMILGYSDRLLGVPYSAFLFPDP